ncbi:hypothetical protein PGTUg99_001619 [Puccinia graminis f. sp. tritici]|uniref:Uncharacterized protein n=1 Tax=Puccinia graminis f. sp. tritici TaxID=56615 RepID=A0A5B0QYU1_PUCGR|nr:hypothetical protein PGTUg99_010912 [Puccinia graminis f. sp. tritici]KAA1129916.1 hypothetical protein PGTUg99_001619 [Puccinia graminis f. sp. tritici]
MEKSWTSASSIFPPWAYESSAETPQLNAESGTNRAGSRKINKTTSGSVTSFEDDPNGMQLVYLANSRL